MALVPMRWWHIPAVIVLERELFGAESWTAAAFWAELADPATRHYVVALRSPALGNHDVIPGESDTDRAATSGSAAEGEVVGYAGLAAYSREAHVLTLGVAGEAQRRGIGAALLRDLLGAAGRAGARDVYLDVRADNPIAQRLYARHGFVPIGTRRGYYQPSGTDAVVMRRDSAASAAARRAGA